MNLIEFLLSLIQGTVVQRQHRLFNADRVQGGHVCIVQGVPARVDSNGAVEFDVLAVLRAHPQGDGRVRILSGDYYSW